MYLEDFPPLFTGHMFYATLTENMTTFKVQNGVQSQQNLLFCGVLV